ncbi:coenzyme F420-dependent oxidoreductase [Photobacterium aphoticum]|uniref:Coenzyme F420-dependent oxidoreductase n=1 Tax=Photobacterium aphoticum TaxID=754436 RepID=A0A090R2D5_9GAMM|nr:coenzyme F420-dependent oxidoreductase [Photobacterium aphoticum]
MKSTVHDVVDRGLCIGCGGCAARALSHDKLAMQLNAFGLYQPTLTGEHLNDDELDSSIAVCPFNPSPLESVKNESVIAPLCLDEPDKHNDYLGSYREIFAGYSHHFRASASSGGVATWLLTNLIDSNEIDGVICVRPGESNTFEYSLVTSSDELEKTSKTKYYPVTLTDMLNFIDETEGRFAITGVPCFIKTIRLRQLQDSTFNDKIAFTVGIFCGGLKTKGFTEYLIRKCGGDMKVSSQVNYRTKNTQGQASDYAFSFYDNESSQQRSIKMRAVGDMWGTGLFKPLACDFCDDLCSELADISLGDAWIQPYNNDPGGTNIIITRSKQASALLQKGINSGELFMDEITEEQACLSQKGNINHRRKGLSHRLAVESLPDWLEKRVPVKKSRNMSFSLVQKQRSKVRALSLSLWEQYHDAEQFDHAIAGELKKLRFLTRINHLTRRDYFIETLTRAIQKIIK